MYTVQVVGYWWTTGGVLVGYLRYSWLIQRCNLWWSLSHGALVISLSHVKHQSEALMMVGALYSSRDRISGLSVQQICS